MTLVPNETEQALNRQHATYAAAREEYRKKIAEQADEIERLRAALEEIAGLGVVCASDIAAIVLRKKIARAGGEVMPVVSHDYINKHRQIVAALVRAQTILENMAMENVNPWRRWPIHHEPLRADAKALLPVIRAALEEGRT